MEIQMTQELIQAYLDTLAETGHSAATVDTYRQRLTQLFAYLPGAKWIRDRTIEDWKEVLLEKGCAARTVNLSLSAANGFLRFCEKPMLQAKQIPKPEKTIPPELTRQEYLRLLSAARLLGNQRSYLLVKVFGTTGLMLRDLSLLTAEAVRAGTFRTSDRIIHLPECLRTELADYARQRYIRSGALFVTKRGIPLDGSNVAAHIQRLGEYAQVPPEKAVPTCLRRMYLATMDGILDTLFPLAERSHEHLLEKEQQVYGWDEVFEKNH